MGSLAMLKQRVESQKIKKPLATEAKKAIGEMKKRTPVTLKSTETINYTTEEENEPKINFDAYTGIVLPMGYHCIGKNDVASLLKLKNEIIKAGICGFDYETNGDPDDDTQDPQDHKLTMVSFAYQIGQAFCMPLAMDAYGANWDVPWFIENFLKPILEHPDVTIICHNVKAEHGWSLCVGIDMFDKAIRGKVMDTMIMVKALALPENTVPMGDGYEVQVGLKPATKALLADKETGLVHGLIHVDDIKSFKDTVGTLEWEEPIPGEFYKSGAKKGLPKTKKCSRSRTFNELPVDQTVIDYSCSDSDWALGLYHKLLPLCHSEGMYDTIVELDVPRMMVLAEYELAGWAINPDRLKAMGDIADKAITEIAPKLQEGLLEVTDGYAYTSEDGEVIVPQGVYGMGEWHGEPISLEIKSDKPFSWGSVQHLQWLFFHVLKVSTNGLERSKTTGLPGTGKENMDTILERYTANGGNKFMDVLKEKRKYDKIKSTYVDGMLPYCRKDTNKLHTQLNLVSTWRLSSKKPNCFDKNTRILTLCGWKYFYELTEEDMVAQFIPETQAIEFVKPLGYIKRKANKLLSFKNQHIDLAVTEDHRCLLQNRHSEVWVTVPASKYRKDARQYHAGTYSFGTNVLSKAEIDLLCMTQADGHYHDGGINYGFSKERKINRFRRLMQALNIPYSSHKDKADGGRKFRILKGPWADFIKEYLGDTKTFGSWVMNLSKQSVLDLLECVYCWDGCFTRDNHYSSNIRTNAEWVQILHVLTGTRANVRIYQGTVNPNYQVDKTGIPHSLTTNVERSEVHYADWTYCVEVPSSYVMVERNGKVMITGNCQNIPRADNDPMGIRGVFEAPTYDVKHDYSGLNPITKPTVYINTGKLSGETVWVDAD